MKNKSWFHLCPCSMPSSSYFSYPIFLISENDIMLTWMLEAKSTWHPSFLSIPLSSSQSLKSCPFPQNRSWICLLSRIYNNPLFKTLSLSHLFWSPAIASLNIVLSSIHIVTTVISSNIHKVAPCLKSTNLMKI